MFVKNSSHATRQTEINARQTTRSKSKHHGIVKLKGLFEKKHQAPAPLKHQMTHHMTLQINKSRINKNKSMTHRKAHQMTHQTIKSRNDVRNSKPRAGDGGGGGTWWCMVHGA